LSVRRLSAIDLVASRRIGRLGATAVLASPDCECVKGIDVTNTPAHDWFLPKLTALIAAAEAAGIARDVAVAVMSDIIDSPDFNTALPQEPDEPRASGDTLPPDLDANPSPGEQRRLFPSAKAGRRGR
jgi:hypothetical protein